MNTDDQLTTLDNTSIDLPIIADAVISIPHRLIEAILFVTAPHDPTDAVTEFRVALRDGRTFALTAYTPAAITRLMAESGHASLVDPGLIIVRTITLAAVLDALEKALRLGIERFGVPI